MIQFGNCVLKTIRAFGVGFQFEITRLPNYPMLYLAGRLGFEPRQSAPKALDLPLVDRPICIYSPNMVRQYSALVSVLVAVALVPLSFRFAAAFSAASADANKP